MKALLALEDGRTFPCKSFTGQGEAFGEIVFNTGMTGYQEILTDPSYRGQMVAMTYPLIGNYGINTKDVESDRIQVSAFLVKEYQDYPSNYRSQKTLAEYLREHRILGLEGLDTRALTRHIRTSGAMRAYISTEDLNPTTCVRSAAASNGLVGKDMVHKVSTRLPYYWQDGISQPTNADIPPSGIWRYPSRKKILVFDFGIKYNILRRLESLDAEILVVSAATQAETVYEYQPDGIFLSNGPGDPEPVTYAINTIRELLGYRPMFGICLGHQLLALALGGKTYKLKFGHRGPNQPVKHLPSGKIEITSQNHGFAVEADSLDQSQIDITHINLNDQTVEGFVHKKLSVLAVQYHPEASPGPHDSEYLFAEFRQRL